MAKTRSITVGKFEFEFEIAEEAYKIATKERKSKVMKEAWRRARRAAEKFGGKASDYMWTGELLKKANEVIPKVARPDAINPKDLLGEEGEVPIDVYEAQYNVIYNAAVNLSKYSGTTGGAALEVQNANTIKEFLSDLKNEIGAKGIIENLNKAGKTVYEVTEKFSVLVQAHYDKTYAAWNIEKNGTEAFKAELSELSKWLSGDSDKLVNAFF